MKYVIPRNKLVPDPNFEDILESGPKFQDKEGNPVGDPSTLYRGTDMSFPKSAMLIEGMLFWFNEGAVYLPKFASRSDMYLDFSKSVAKAGVTQVLAGGVESIVGELPIHLAALVHERIEHTLFPEKEHAASRLSMIAAELIKKGAVYLPSIQLVELEFQWLPPKFLRKAEHRILFTYERFDGERETYGLRFYSSQPPESWDAFILDTFKSRMQTEFGRLITAIQKEQINSEQLWASYIEKYQSRYGEKWREHGAELVTEFKNACDEELERKGFLGFGRNLRATVLERVAPLVPYYQKVPMFKEMVQSLESGDPNIKLPTALER